MTKSASLVRTALYLAVISSTLAAPVDAERRRLPVPPVNASEAFDDGLYVDEGGPVSGGKGWLRLETDACGLPQPDREVRLRHQAGVWDEPVPDESDIRWMVFNMWLSTHPEVVVMSDGVDKSCDDSVFEDDDSDAATLARWGPRDDPQSRDRFARKGTFDIA